MLQDRFTVMAFRKDGWMTVRSVNAQDIAGAIDAALQIPEWPSFDRVEVWTEGACVHVIEVASHAKAAA